MNVKVMFIAGILAATAAGAPDIHEFPDKKISASYCSMSRGNLDTVVKVDQKPAGVGEATYWIKNQSGQFLVNVHTETRADSDWLNRVMIPGRQIRDDRFQCGAGGRVLSLVKIEAVADPPVNTPSSARNNPSGTIDPNSLYFPPDTLQSLAEYSMVGSSLVRFQKELMMIIRIDGVRSINGKTYFKQVTEYTGQEDLLQFLKSPEMPAAATKAPEVKAFIEQLEAMSKPSVEYSRWDQIGEWDLDSDDLTKPEVLAQPLNVDVGTEWDAQGVHAKAVSLEDIKIGDQTYKDCLKIRLSGPDSVQGLVVYAARGIGAVEYVLPRSMGDFSWVLKKYRQ